MVFRCNCMLSLFSPTKQKSNTLKTKILKAGQIAATLSKFNQLPADIAKNKTMDSLSACFFNQCLQHVSNASPMCCHGCDLRQAVMFLWKIDVFLLSSVKMLKWKHDSDFFASHKQVAFLIVVTVQTTLHSLSAVPCQGQTFAWFLQNCWGFSCHFNSHNDRNDKNIKSKKSKDVVNHSSLSNPAKARFVDENWKWTTCWEMRLNTGPRKN